MIKKSCSRRKCVSYLLNGDAAEVLRDIPDGIVDCVVTSPPYWGTRSYGGRKEIGAEKDLRKYIANLELVFDEVWRVLKAGGTCWLNIGDRYSSAHRKYRGPDRLTPHRVLRKRPRDPEGVKQKELIGIPWRLAEALRSRGWYVRAEIVWYKRNALPESVRDRPMRAHEIIFLLVKSAHYRVDGGFSKSGILDLKRSVWEVGVGTRENMYGHPAVFPLRLVKGVLDVVGGEGLKIMDPFCGSGTVGLAALERGHDFVGIDLSRRYIRIARKLIEKNGGCVCNHAEIARAL